VNGQQQSSLKARTMAAVIAAVGGGGGFGVASVAGLKLWLKADALALNDNDPVTNWPDQSGLANDAEQAVAAQKPLFKTNIVNGKPVVRFDGVNDVLEVNPGIAAAPYTLFVVAKAVANGTAYLVDMGGGTISIGPYDAGLWGFWSTQTPSMYRIGGATGNWTVISLVHTSAASAQGWNNGASPSGLFDPANTALDATWTIGAETTGGGGPMDGDVAEMLVYDTALSTANRQLVQNYLGGKYGIAIS
jgi:hypothetical protein